MSGLCPRVALVIARLISLLSAWSVERRGWVLGLSLLFCVVFGAAVPSLRIDTSPDALVSSVEGHAEVEAHFRETFGGSNSRLLVLLEGEGILSRVGLEYQRQLSKELRALTIVSKVEGLPSFLPQKAQKAPTEEHHLAMVKSILARMPWVIPIFLSRDHSTAALVVEFHDRLLVDQETRLGALFDVRAVLAKRPPPANIALELGGVPILSETILKKLEQDRLILNPAMMLICLFVLALTFRWWPAVVAPLCAVGIAALGVVGGLSYLGVPLTILTNIVPPLLIIVGLSDSVHLLGRYDEELQFESNRVEAGRRAARAMLVACFVTSLTTAVGFGSLVMAETPELGRFGLAAAAGVILAYFATVLFVPAFVTFFPRGAVSGSGTPRIGFIERLVFQITRLVLRRAAWVAVGTFLIGSLLVALSRGVTVDARLLDAFEEGEPVTALTRKLEQKLAGIRPLEIVVESDEDLRSLPLRQHFDGVAKWARAEADVIAMTGYFEIVPPLEASPFPGGSAPQDFTAWLSPDGRTGRLTVFFKDAGIQKTLKILDGLSARLNQGSGAKLRVSYTGEAYTGSVGRDSVLRDLVSGLGFALVTIFVLLGILFRSVPLALIAIPPNVIPLFATSAYMMMRDIHLNMATVITFSIGIGLAVDDTVHVVARYREEERRISSVRVGLLRAARGTGRAIVVTALSLGLGFSVLLFSEFVSVRQFGELIAFTVLMCLLSALIIQPALLSLVTKKRAPIRT